VNIESRSGESDCSVLERAQGGQWRALLHLCFSKVLAGKGGDGTSRKMNSKLLRGQGGYRTALFVVKARGRSNDGVFV